MGTSNTVFSAFSFITLVLVCIPFPWHLEAWNTGTCLYMAWTAVALLSLFINSVVWSNNAIDWAPVWCDISSKIIVGISVALPAASLCINHRLYCIAAVRSVTRTKAEKRRAIMVDLTIGLGIPFVVMALHYIVQGHRYNIFEEVGCFPFTYNTPPAYPLILMMPIVIGLTSGTYSIMSIIAFRKRHAEFKEILSANSNLSSNRFFRLMALAGIEVMCCVPLGITAVVMNATHAEIRPWISWEDTHYGFSRVDQFPSVLWKSDFSTRLPIEMSRWFVVVCGLTFFAFFGFAEEAQKHYKMAIGSVSKRIGHSTFTGSTNIGFGNGSTSGFGKFKGLPTPKIPIFVHQDVIEKRDSLDTLSDMTSVRSDFGSTPYDPLAEKQPNLVLEPSTIVPSSESDHSSTTVVETAAPLTCSPRIPSSASLRSSGSFLDLSYPGNENNV